MQNSPMKEYRDISPHIYGTVAGFLINMVCNAQMH